ncbi:hypothetical protein OIDMADRAFT_33577 [Oidiodendron maius Zn]|uniref:Uncharacterized protein n=1 Tax=Oidiodendron maius (strain Zn) TaxID=913774 RepID=A0A0C3D2R6_OIDMZ|nr:hypothetical protein OIDMADRAFT_33577 [Oidiodendron maius Zn]
MRPILNSYNREILKCASDQFLDLDKALRLKPIDARDLVNLLTKAERLEHREANVIEDDAADAPVYEAHESAQHRLRANFVSMPLCERLGQGRSDSTASPQPSPVEASREPKHLRINERRSLESPSLIKIPYLASTLFAVVVNSMKHSHRRALEGKLNHNLSSQDVYLLQSTLEKRARVFVAGSQVLKGIRDFFAHVNRIYKPAKDVQLSLLLQPNED